MSLADDANLLLIPTGYKAEKLYSIFPTSGVGDFDFARTTTATRVAKNGLITTVGTNVPRLNYDILDGEVVGCPHLLLEPERTNLIQYSEDFSNAYWIKSGSSIVSNNVISPDGSLNASKLVEDTANSDHSIYRTFTGLTSAVYTISAYVKKGERHKCALADRNTGVYVSFDLNNATIIEESLTVGNIESLPNGWYKLSATTSNALTTFVPQIFVLEDSYTTGTPILLPYIGDGTSGIYIYGAMLEQGSYSTSYIKSNSGSPTTRAAETCNGSGNAATFNDSEGVLMAEISALVNDNNFKSISVSESNADNRITLSLYQGSLFAYIADGGVGQFNVSQSVGSVLEFHKTAIKYKANDCAFWIDGFEVAINTSPTTMPSGLKELAFDQGNGGDKFYGKTKQIQYHSTVLSDSNLEKLTSWTSFEDMAQSQLYTIQ
jgi:hypothetical protein